MLTLLLATCMACHAPEDPPVSSPLDDTAVADTADSGDSGQDTSDSADTGHDTGHDTGGDTGDDTGEDTGGDTGGDTGTVDCVDYSDTVADCLALVAAGTGGGDTWDTIDAASATLKSDLHAIITGHTAVSYGDLWDAFPTTDPRGGGLLFDIYSDPGDGSDPAYLYDLEADRCGTYGREGDCYNREHTWPRSWFGDLAPMRSDLHQIYPVDGYVNSKRSSYPYGPVGVTTWTSTNGSLLGDSALCDHTGRVFEPIDAYKGDVARALLYMSVRYEGEDGGWSSSEGTDGASLEPWFEQVLLAWHITDPVSDKERTRNDAVEALQGNRNPFVDHPEYACAIMDF